MKKHKNPTQSKFKGPGPVQKIEFLAKVASLAQLSRADLAVLITVTDMINSRTGDAWPSYKTLGTRSGCSDRHAKSTVSGLIQKELLRIVMKGNRIRSNRYAINLAAPIINTNFCSDLSHTSVVMSDDASSEVQQHEVMISASHKSIHEPEHQARDEMNGSPDGDASPLGAKGPFGSHPPGTDHYPDFWEAYPLRARVAEAEQQISEWVAEGVDYREIIEGAQRYKEYCAATGGLKRSDAFSWLSQQRWRDGWNLPTKKDATSVKRPTQNSKNNSSQVIKKTDRVPKTTINPEFKKWQEYFYPIKKNYFDAKEKFESHVGLPKQPACRTCHNYFYKDLGSICDLGFELGQKNYDNTELFYKVLKERPRERIKIK